MADYKEGVKIAMGRVAKRIETAIREHSAMVEYRLKVPAVYERTWDYARSWTAMQNGLMDYVIESLPSIMRYEPAKYRHGNDDADRRANLTQYLNEYTNYDFGNLDHWRGFFEEFLEKLDSGLLDSIVREEFANEGLPLIAI
jgi:hypothetical protein